MYSNQDDNQLDITVAPEYIEMPTELMSAAVQEVIPFLAKSHKDRSNSIETCDYSRTFIEALIKEIEAGEPFCDHSVGICACGTQGILRELHLALNGEEVCPDCKGEGYIEMISDASSLITGRQIRFAYDCKTCNKTGTINKIVRD